MKERKQAMALRLVQEPSQLNLRINFTFTGTEGEWTMWVRHGVLNARPGHAEGAQLTLSGPKPALAAVLLQPGHATALVEKGQVTADGDLALLDALAGVTEEFDAHFNLATP